MYSTIPNKSTKVPKKGDANCAESQFKKSTKKHIDIATILDNIPRIKKVIVTTNIIFPDTPNKNMNRLNIIDIKDVDNVPCKVSDFKVFQKDGFILLVHNSLTIVVTI